MLDISVEWAQNLNIVPANIRCLHYRALEFVDHVPFSHINYKI